MSAPAIPVLDLSRLDADRDAFLAAFRPALRGTGFVVLTGHGVADALRDEAFAQADRFFARPVAEKARVTIQGNPHNRGWAAPGLEKLDEAGHETDTKEAFNIGLDLPPDDAEVLAGAPFRGVNQWPDLPGFAETMRAYYDAAHHLGMRVLRAVALDLGLEEDRFEAPFRRPSSTLRLLRYPAATGAAGEIGAGAHTDYGAVTLLMTDGEPGLQVRPRGGGWTDVPHVPGAYVVNIGDAMERWTGGLYASTPHRVLPPARPRRSVAFFHEPDPQALIEALPGAPDPRPPIRFGEHLRARLDATYAVPAS
jgi:isopenicillin N synthase-like dioxygenase